MASVVTDQPGALGGSGPGMPSTGAAPGQAIAGCPPDLEHLAVAEKITVKQRTELLEAITGFETANQYVLLNTENQQIYKAAEQSNCLVRWCCGTSRPFDMLVVDNANVEVMRFSRPFRCCGGRGGCSCWPRCCLQKMDVTRAGQLLGVVTQDPCSTSLSVRTAQGDTVLRVRRRCCQCQIPCCFCCFPSCREIRFSISSEDGREVGAISKQWGGMVKEGLTDADSFTLEIQRDLDITVKATVLAAVFLIDFLFFEE